VTHQVTNLICKKFNRLTVVSGPIKGRDGRNAWKCQCICGKEKVIREYCLLSKHTQSCGCFNRERVVASIIKAHLTHGKTKSSEFLCWGAMLARCYNSKHKAFKNYGGRGIKVCKEWKNSFSTFYKDMGNRPKGLELDRIDNSKSYSLSNCRWTTRKEQASNRRTNTFYTLQGETHTLSQWAELLGVKKCTLWRRIKRLNWPIEKALSRAKDFKKLLD